MQTESRCVDMYVVNYGYYVVGMSGCVCIPAARLLQATRLGGDRVGGLAVCGSWCVLCVE